MLDAYDVVRTKRDGYHLETSCGCFRWIPVYSVVGEKVEGGLGTLYLNSSQVVTASFKALRDGLKACVITGVTTVIPRLVNTAIRRDYSSLAGTLNISRT